MCVYIHMGSSLGDSTLVRSRFREDQLTVLDVQKQWAAVRADGDAPAVAPLAGVQYQLPGHFLPAWHVVGLCAKKMIQ